MHTFDYNEYTTLGYKYIPVGGGNALLPTRYRTEVYLVQDNGNYNMGYWDEKLDEEQIKYRFEEIMRVNQEARYGTQGTILRRELSARRERGHIGGAYINRGITRSIGDLYKDSDQ